MSKSLVFVLAFLCLAAACLGSEAAAPDPPEPLRAVELMPHSPVRALPGQKSVPSWNFSVNPNPIITNYYDYMIGGYNNLPGNTARTSILPIRTIAARSGRTRSCSTMSILPNWRTSSRCGCIRQTG